MANQNLFEYVNKDWIKKTSIPSYRGTYGISEELEENIEKKLISLLKKYEIKHKDSNIGRIVHSILNESVQKFNVEKMKLFLKTIDCSCFKVSDVCKQIGILNKYQINSPINILINHDVYNSKKCLIHLYEPELGLPTYDHYNKDNKDIVLVSYKQMLEKVGAELESPDLEQILHIEKEVLKHLSYEGDLSDPTKSHNEFSFEDLQKSYKHIDWNSLFEGYGLKLLKNDILIVTNLRYLKMLDKMFEKFDLKVWSIWLRTYAVLNLIRYLPPPFDDYHYKLFGDVLRGEGEKLPQEKLLLTFFDNFCNQTLSQIYVNEVILLENAKKIKQQAMLLVTGLKQSTIRLIRKSKWMSVQAKKMAILKVNRMKFQVGFEDKKEINELDGLDISNKCLIENLLLLSEKKTLENIKKIGNNCDKFNDKWEDGSYEVNAYYYADQNKMVVPLGILQQPFFDMSKSVAWNYGGIGAAIGHEITHAFDEDGHHYDYKGSWIDWWNASDKHQYSLITNKVQKLYDGLKYMDGFVDGYLTFDENLADIGGLEIALEALNQAILLGKLDESEKKKMYMDFFISFAMSWRLKDRPKKAKQSLLLDHHSPAIYRVNIPVAMFDEYYIAFNVESKHKMFIDKKERVKLFSN